jgi:hypothetical protein
VLKENDQIKQPDNKKKGENPVFENSPDYLDKWVS